MSISVRTCVCGAHCTTLVYCSMHCAVRACTVSTYLCRYIYFLIRFASRLLRPQLSDLPPPPLASLGLLEHIGKQCIRAEDETPCIIQPASLIRAAEVQSKQQQDEEGKKHRRNASFLLQFSDASWWQIDFSICSRGEREEKKQLKLYKRADRDKKICFVTPASVRFL